MQDDFALAYKSVSKIGRTLNLKHLDTKMSAAGAECGNYAGAKKGFFFPQYENVEDMHAALDTTVSEDGVLGEIVLGNNGGF